MKISDGIGVIRGDVSEVVGIVCYFCSLLSPELLPENCWVVRDFKNLCFVQPMWFSAENKVGRLLTHL